MGLALNVDRAKYIQSSNEVTEPLRPGSHVIVDSHNIEAVLPEPFSEVACARSNAASEKPQQGTQSRITH